MHSNAGAPRGNSRRDSLGGASMGGASMGTGFSRSPTRGRRPELGRSDGPPQRHYRVRQQSMAPSDTTGMVVSNHLRRSLRSINAAIQQSAEMACTYTEVQGWACLMLMTATARRMTLLDCWRNCVQGVGLPVEPS